MDPHLAPALDALAGWARGRHGPGARVALLRQVPLTGGHVAGAVTRLDVEVSTEAGTTERVSVVLKRAEPGEMRAMRALREVPERPRELPELLGEGAGATGAWVLMPFFAGGPLNGPIPASVFRALAGVHTAFAGRAGGMDAIPPITQESWSRLCRHVLGRVEEARSAGSHPILDRAVDSLMGRAVDIRLARALDVLPRTLVHGDMHAGNVIVSPDGAAIIDWGNARLGPALLDLANITGMGSPEFQVYLDRCGELTGVAADQRLTTIGFLWATVYVNTAYLAFAVIRDFLGSDGVRRHPPAVVDGMIDRAESALERLGRELSRRESSSDVRSGGNDGCG